jgi:hypothetical protein
MRVILTLLHQTRKSFLEIGGNSVMLTATRSTFAWTTLLIGFGACPAADPLSKEEVARLGKASTALVVVKPQTGYGSAFCVHASGLFITNEHVVRNAGTIDLVLDPGLKSQKVLAAKVLRADKDLDLALVRVEGAKELAALPLGSDDKLSELAEVIAFGFPFGAELSPDKKEFPAVSVNAGSITSLRHKDGELFRIQVDASLNPGNSGGPVLDRNGKVIGVVVAGVRGSGVNFVIPVSHVTRFVARPELEASLPALTAANMHKPALFQVKAAFVLPAHKPPELELILKGADGKERKHKMELTDGSYRTTAVPIPAPDGPRTVRVTAVYAEGSVTSSVADLEFKVGDKSVKLSEVRRVRMKPPQALMDDGKAVEGAVSGLDSLKVRLGGQELALKLADAVELTCEAQATADSVAYTIIATVDGKEVGRLSDTLRIAAPMAADLPRAADTRVEIKPPVLDKDKVVKALPGAVGETCLAGAGRYLILHFPKLRKLGVFDVNEAKITGYINVAEDNIKFAAGVDRVLIVLPSARLLQRWNLKTLERELSVALPFEGTVKSMCMGWAGTGPMLVAGEGGFPHGGGTLIDTNTLKPLKFEGRTDFSHNHYRASAEGKVFTMWHDPGQGRCCLSLVGNEAKLSVDTTRGYILASPDGETLYGNTHTGAGGFYCQTGVIYTKEFKVMSGGEREGVVRRFLPAAQGRYYCDLKVGDANSSLKFYLAGDTRIVASLDGIDLKMGDYQAIPTAIDRGLFVLPDAKVVITVLPGTDTLTLYRFDVEDALEKSGIDYLLVTSVPPTWAKKGTTFEYALTVKSKKGGVKFRVESGPKGMAVNAAGKVKWDVPADFGEKELAVIITVTDSAGQETFHSFRLTVRD